MSQAKLKITKIPKMNILVIKQEGGKFFIATRDSIVIDIFGLSSLLKFMIFNGLISPKVLEGVLEEYNSVKGEGYVVVTNANE